MVLVDPAGFLNVLSSFIINHFLPTYFFHSSLRFWAVKAYELHPPHLGITAMLGFTYEFFLLKRPAELIH
jgi:hypothetical protein